LNMDNHKQQNINIICLVAVILSACSIFYELIIAQTLSALASNTVLWYSLTIGLYLGSMGCGALLCSNIYKNKCSWSDLFKIELLLSIAGALAVPILHFTHTIFIFLTMHGILYPAATVLYLVFFMVVVVIGILTGFELPLLISLGNEQSKTQNVTNRVLFADYSGSLVGALIFSLVLLPNLELLSIGYWIALINLSAALFILVYFVKKITVSNVALFAALYALLFLCLVCVPPMNQYFLKKEYFYKYVDNGTLDLFQSLKNFPDIERHTSLYQKIDIVQIPKKHNKEQVLRKFITGKYKAELNFPKGRILYLNHAFQFNSEGEETYHEYLAHVPINVSGAIPPKILVLGAGDGLLVRELIKYPQVEHITLIDLDQKMIDLANTHPVFTAINKGSFKDPRVEIKIADAYYFMKNNREQYDAIYIDFPVANNYDLSKLYSREFYFFVHRSLSEDGFAAFESANVVTPFTDDYEDYVEFKHTPSVYWDIYFNTIKAAGFDTIIPFCANFTGQRSVMKQTIYNYINQNAQEWEKMAAEDRLDPVAYDKIQHHAAGYLADKYIASNMDGFIMMKKGVKKGNFKFKNFDIPLYVLNKETFKDAFAYRDLYKERINPIHVNSIMRPVLPRSLYLYVYDK